MSAAPRTGRRDAGGSGPASVLVLSPGAASGSLSGPEIRAAEFARALAREAPTTLASPAPEPGELDGVRVIPATRRRLLQEARRHDVVISACLPPYLLLLKRRLGILAIADLYDPMEHELATMADPRARAREEHKRAAILLLQLRRADRILCAGGAQVADLRARAETAGLTIPDPMEMPFGIPQAPPPSRARPLRARFPQIADGDRIVLWWGSVWRWLDADTAIRAMAELAPRRGDVKLVICAGRPPNGLAGPFDATDAARALAAELGLLESSVLFLDEWVPYASRHEYLAEADLGLTLHRHGAEAQLAARARYMDYLWTGLPCVLGRGDDTAEAFAAAGFARLVENPDPGALARVLTDLLDDPAALGAARRAGARLAAERRWDAVGARLRETIDAARARPGQVGEAALSWRESTDYYLRELSGRVRSRWA